MKKLPAIVFCVLLSLLQTTLCARQDNNATMATLQAKLQKSNLTISNQDAMINPEFVELVVNTESMSRDEKQYWLDALPTLADEQISRVVKILSEEKQKLGELEQQYVIDKQQLEIKQAKELIEKVYDALSLPKAKKPTQIELDECVESIDLYLSESRAKDTAVLSKIVVVLKEMIKDKTISGLHRATLHKLAYFAYAGMNDKSKTYHQIYHLTKSTELLRELQDSAYENSLSGMLASLAYLLVCDKQYAKALDAANEAIALAKDVEHRMLAAINKAHALVFIGNTEEAKKLYLEALGSEIWQEVAIAIGSDIKEFREFGLPSDKITVIESVLGDFTDKASKKE